MAVSIPLLVFFLLLIVTSASKCPKSFNCGNLTSLEFPLTLSQKTGCGLLMVNCTEPANPRIQLTGDGRQYQILEKISVNRFKLVDPVIEEGLKISQSCLSFRNVSFPFIPATSLSFTPDLTFFTCDNRSNVSGETRALFKGYRNYTGCGGFTVFYSNSTDRFPPGSDGVIPDCAAVQMPVKSNQDSGDLFNMLTGEFELEWNVSEECVACHRRGGQCLANNLNKFECKEGESGLSTGEKVLIGMAIIVTIAVVAAFIIIYIRRKRRFKRLQLVLNQETNPNVENFLFNHEYLAPKKYKYSQIKKITKSFSDKLGQGEYGSVYKGTLPNGQFVAVKLLTETKSNGEDFINEVASISRTSHVNIVNLLGFCYEKNRRALVYEFMPNKSLDKFISTNGSLGTTCLLDWGTLYKIAVGVARGLEYLHKGCNTKIVHFDIKPQNILLDEEFCPKISDFGLAKLCKKKQSILSMAGTRGTIGYIAPEVFSRNFGGVSHKSDVYSYGMMILEMAGARNIVGLGSMQSSENYFPDKIYEQVILHETENVEADASEKEATRKMFLVGFWCIQTIPSDRPSMSKVVEMLEGSLDSIQIPPKPFLFTPASLGQELSPSASGNAEIESSIEGEHYN